MGNWLTDSIEETANWLNRNVDRYINPFYIDQQSKDGVKTFGDDSAPLGEYLSQSTESFFRAWNWAYDNAISQPIATVQLQARRPDKLFSAAEWSRTWRAAEHISLGQASDITKGGSRDLVERVIDSPLRYYKPPAGELPPGFDELPDAEQQRILKDAGMPVDPFGGNQVIHDMRQESLGFSLRSGTYDFTARWFADPLVVGGKAAGAVRRATVAQRRPAAGWSPEKIDELVNSSKMAKFHDFLVANRDNPQLVNNTDMALKSSMGPRLGAVNALLHSPDEVRDFIRVGLGDVAAQERLEGANVLARARMQTDTSRLAAINLIHARYAGGRDPRMAALAQQHIDQLNQSISADAAMVGRYEQILQHSDELDEIFLSRWSFTRAQQRTEAQNAYLARPARGGSLSMRRGAKGVAARQFRAEVPEKAVLPGVYKTDAQGQIAMRSVESGFVATRLWGIGDFFTTPVTAVRMMKNVHPNGYMALDQGTAFEAGNIAELRAQLARIPGIKQETRTNVINQYLKTATDVERKKILDDLGRVAVSKIAAKHGLSAQAGREIFEAQRLKLLGEIDNMQQYSAAMKPRPGEPPLRVDAFEVEGGIKIQPHTVSRIMNSHILPDLDQFNRTLARHSSALRAIRESHAGNPDWILSAGDYLNHLWKFTTLFRLGYIPRTIGDDIASQWARLGTAAMAMRAGYGVKNGLTNLAHREARTFNEMKEKMHVEAMKYASDEIGLLKPQISKLGGKVAAERLGRQQAVTVAQHRVDWVRQQMQNLPTNARPAQVAALRRLWNTRIGQLDTAKRSAAKAGSAKNVRLRDLELRAGTLEEFYNLSARAANDAHGLQQKVFQGANAIKVGDTVFPAAFGGQRGDYYMQRISPNTAYDQLFKTPKQLVHANLMRSFDHGARPIAAIDDEVKHGAAWAHAINAQIAGDQMQRLLVAGRSEAEVVNWLKSDPAGMAYWRRLNLKVTDPEDVVARARFEVDEYLPLPEIRAQALTDEGVSPQFLTEALPKIDHRPVVHMANVGQAPMSSIRAMDRVMQTFYNVAVTLPAKALSRQPLFNQLYEGHLRTVVGQRAKQGAETKTVADVDRVTETARRLAERDMKRLVFDIAHSSDASAALRWISPFFSATAESFQRWGRVIADRPEVLGYAANFYNAPAYLGHMQDQDGNTIHPDGTVVNIDPTTGKAKKTLVRKADRFIVGRMPDWLIDSPVGIALGVERSSGNFALSQNSMNIVTQGDPWFSPGVGPVVQIPVNELVKDKPEAAELARHLGILPFGPATGATPVERAARQTLPGTVRHFLTAFDTGDYRYQQVKMQIMQRAIFEHEELGKKMLTAEEINDRARNYWFFSAASAFVQPMATKRIDGYQMYRDQYNILRRANPETADQEFLNRFGEEYFIFAQSMSRNTAGVPATKKAVELSQRYADVLAEFPEFGALIIGAEGNGPFSPEAYAYQLNTPLVPGDAESQRRRLSAEEAVKENQRRKGWAYFSSVMDWLTAQAVQRGLNSIEDEGAGDLMAVKKAFVTMLGEPMIGEEANPFYNEEWSQDYFSFDARKYERMVPALTRVAGEVLKEDPERGDMRSLLLYLEGRKAVVTALDSREFTTLGAQANADLRSAWTGFVGQLVERDTNFGSLHSRYLSRDLGVDVEDEVEAIVQQLEDDVEGVGE